MKFVLDGLFFAWITAKVTCPARLAQRVSAARRTYRLGISGMAGFEGMRLALIIMAILASLASLDGPASALVGEASPADIVIQRHTIIVYSAKGRCSGVVLAQDLVLTAAHCVESPDIAYRIGGVVAQVRFTGGGVAEVVRHPDFRKAGRFEADLALIKLKEPLSGRFTPAFLQGRPVREGERVIAGGYGKGDQGNERATLRSARLVVSRVSRGLVSLSDTDHGGPQPGGCSGDSGGPVFTYRGLVALVGVIVGGDCKGKTGIVPVSQHYPWIVETAEKLGSPLK